MTEPDPADGSNPADEAADPGRTNSAVAEGDVADIDAAFDLLSNARRRGVLYAVNREGATTVDELARRIAAWQGDAGDHSVEQVRTSLVHAHLPRLDDAGVVDYDRGSGTVEPADADALDPLLCAAGESARTRSDADHHPGLAD